MEPKTKVDYFSENRSNIHYFDFLPNELLQYTFEFLDPSTIIISKQVSHRWYNNIMTLLPSQFIKHFKGKTIKTIAEQILNAQTKEELVYIENLMSFSHHRNKKNMLIYILGINIITYEYIKHFDKIHKLSVQIVKTTKKIKFNEFESRVARRLRYIHFTTTITDLEKYQYMCKVHNSPFLTKGLNERSLEDLTFIYLSDRIPPTRENLDKYLHVLKTFKHPMYHPKQLISNLKYSTSHHRLSQEHYHEIPKIMVCLTTNPNFGDAIRITNRTLINPRINKMIAWRLIKDYPKAIQNYGSPKDTILKAMINYQIVN